MFGYKLIKTTEFETLKSQLADVQIIANTQAKRIAELEKEVKEHEATIANLTKPTTVKNENVEEKIEKPVKKVRRKSSKKTTKKEE